MTYPTSLDTSPRQTQPLLIYCNLSNTTLCYPSKISIDLIQERYCYPNQLSNGSHTSPVVSLHITSNRENPIVLYTGIASYFRGEQTDRNDDSKFISQWAFYIKELSKCDQLVFSEFWHGLPYLRAMGDLLRLHASRKCIPERQWQQGKCFEGSRYRR